MEQKKVNFFILHLFIFCCDDTFENTYNYVQHGEELWSLYEKIIMYLDSFYIEQVKTPQKFGHLGYVAEKKLTIEDTFLKRSWPV